MVERGDQGVAWAWAMGTLWYCWLGLMPHVPAAVVLHMRCESIWQTWAAPAGRGRLGGQAWSRRRQPGRQPGGRAGRQAGTEGCAAGPPTVDLQPIPAISHPPARCNLHQRSHPAIQPAAHPAHLDEGVPQRILRADPLVWVQLHHSFQQVHQLRQLAPVGRLPRQQRCKVLLDGGVGDEAAHLAMGSRVMGRGRQGGRWVDGM